MVVNEGGKFINYNINVYCIKLLIITTKNKIQQSYMNFILRHSFGLQHNILSFSISRNEDKKYYYFRQTI